MSLRRTLQGSMATALFFVLTHAAATTLEEGARLPDVPAPPLGHAQWVARSIRVNGLPMTIKSFDTPMPVDDVLHHYARWASGKFEDSFRTQQGDWQVLSLRSSAYLITIQVRPNGGGSHGTIAVSPAPNTVAPTVASRFPLPPSLQVVNLQQYEDLGVEAEHISLQGTRAPHVEAEAFEALLSREGWQLTREQTQRASRGFVLEAQKGAQHALIAVFPDRTRSARTAAVVIWRKS
jgi:hypothetical protein